MSIQRYNSDQLRQIDTEQNPPFTLDFLTMSAASPAVTAPRALRSREPVHRTPNLLENTSLDENFNALPPMPPRPRVILHRREREMLQQRIQQRREEELEYRQFLRDQQRDVQYAKKVDRRAERLYKHREKEPALTAALTEVLQKWQKHSPSSHEKFKIHCHNAGIVSETTVRFTDIALWYAEDMPADVRKALEAKSKHLHTEAWLQRDLNRAEREAAWRPDDFKPVLHTEIEYAADSTEIIKTGGRLKCRKHFIFGTFGLSIEFFTEKFLGKGEERKRFYHILASFHVRKVWFQNKALSDGSTSKYLPSWCVLAMRNLKDLTVGSSSATCPVKGKQQCEKLYEDIKDFSTSIKKGNAEIDAAIARIKKVLKPKCIEYHKDRDITPARKAVLEQEFQEMKDYLLDIERRFGVRSLPPWESLLDTEFYDQEGWEIVEAS